MSTAAATTTCRCAGNRSSSTPLTDPGFRRAYERAMARDVERLAIFTDDLFATPHDEANRAAVAAVSAAELDLVGLALQAERKIVDKVLDKLRPHRSQFEKMHRRRRRREGSRFDPRCRRARGFRDPRQALVPRTRPWSNADRFRSLVTRRRQRARRRDPLPAPIGRHALRRRVARSASQPLRTLGCSR